jgi:hypothetical protein
VRCFKLPHRPSGTHLHTLAQRPTHQHTCTRVARCELPQSAHVSSPDSRMTGTVRPPPNVPPKKQQNCMQRERPVASVQEQRGSQY